VKFSEYYFTTTTTTTTTVNGWYPLWIASLTVILLQSSYFFCQDYGSSATCSVKTDAQVVHDPLNLARYVIWCKLKPEFDKASVQVLFSRFFAKLFNSHCNCTPNFNCFLTYVFMCCIVFRLCHWNMMFQFTKLPIRAN